MVSDGKQLEEVTHKQQNPDEIIIGIRPVAEAIMSGNTIDRVMVKRGISGEGYREVLGLIKKNGIPLQYVPDAKLNQLTRKNHQGIIGFLSLVEYADLDKVIENAFHAGRDPLIILLDRVTDVRNFGAIARTAECAGADAILIPERGTARINSESIKASAGGLLRIPVCRTVNLFKSAVSMMERGLLLVSANEKSKLTLHNADLTGPLCLIMGSEEDGVSAPLLKMSSQQVAIPQYGKIGSLNVSVAAGILLFEIARQRKVVQAD